MLFFDLLFFGALGALVALLILEGVGVTTVITTGDFVGGRVLTVGILLVGSFVARPLLRLFVGGLVIGAGVGAFVGLLFGLFVGVFVTGAPVGLVVGLLVGILVGRLVVGAIVGAFVGLIVGIFVGELVTGDDEGALVGLWVGEGVIDDGIGDGKLHEPSRAGSDSPL